MTGAFSVKFWGVRGSIPVSGPDITAYGGSTSCVEVRCGDRLIILDAGTGMYPLSKTVQEKQIDILLSHTHLDHVIGLLFFTPLYDKTRHVRIWAGHLLPEHTLEEMIDRLMFPPLFPLTRDILKAHIEYANFHAGEALNDAMWQPGGIRIETLLLSHPDRATGYRIHYAGKSLCYITDIEHTPGTLDAKLVEFIRGATCLIYDATYDDAEFHKYTGWGHSTWQQAVRLADAANVEKVMLFHHDPSATDSVLAAREKQLLPYNGRVILTREGMDITL